MTKAKWGEHAEIIRKLCARKNGCSMREAADTIDRPLNGVSGYLVKMIKAGEAYKAGVHGEYRYFKNKKSAEEFHLKAVAEHAAELEASKKRKNDRRAQAERDKRAKERAAKGLEPYVKPVKKPKVDLKPRYSGISIATKQQALDNKRAHQKATITWPDNVKVQVIPHGEDTRFKFNPEPGWKGQITQDWYDRRLAA